MTDILARQRRAACQVFGLVKAREEEVYRAHNRNIFFDIYCDILSGNIYSKLLLAILSDMFVIVCVCVCVCGYVLVAVCCVCALCLCVCCGCVLWLCVVAVCCGCVDVDQPSTHTAANKLIESPCTQERNMSVYNFSGGQLWRASWPMTFATFTFPLSC